MISPVRAMRKLEINQPVGWRNVPVRLGVLTLIQTAPPVSKPHGVIGPLTYIYKCPRAYTYILTHTCACIYIRIHPHIYIHTHIHIYFTHIYIYKHPHTYTYAYIHTHTYPRIYICTYIRICIYIHIYIYTYQYVYTYIYAHTYTAHPTWGGTPTGHCVKMHAFWVGHKYKILLYKKARSQADMMNLRASAKPFEIWGVLAK